MASPRHRRLANARSPIAEETPQEDLRNALMILREISSGLSERDPENERRLQTEGWVRIEAEGLQAIFDALAAVDRRIEFAIKKLEGHRANPPASESRSLDEALHLLKQVRVVDEASHQLVKEIAFILGQLRHQVRIGVHTNPPPEGRIQKVGIMLRAKNDVNGNPRRVMVVVDTMSATAYSLDTDRIVKPSEVYVILDVETTPGEVRRLKNLPPYRLHNSPSRAAQKFIGKKIELLAHEEVPVPKRIAEAYAIARQKGFKGISLAARGRKGRLRQNPATLAVLGLNPPVRIDRSVDPIEAMWGEIHYVRPDDPEGEVVRVHEFEVGFRALPLTDGRVLLESRQDRRLWTVE